MKIINEMAYDLLYIIDEAILDRMQFLKVIEGIELLFDYVPIDTSEL